MKLRIEDDSVRLRLKQYEVARLRNDGIVESALHFSTGRALTYSVTASPEAPKVSVTYNSDAIRVTVPRAMANVWADSDQVTLEGAADGVRILVEKDFQCLHKPGDPEAFPNPLSR
jgi:hypothetical protein